MKHAENWILLAPELFRAPGGIARVSRHYLRAMAENCGSRAMKVLALNDQILPPVDLAECQAEGVEAVSCSRSKMKCASNLWRMCGGGSSHVICTHVAMAPLIRIIKLLRPSLSFDIVVHGIEVWRELPRSQHRALTDARLIFSVSDYTRRELVTRYPEFAGKTHVLPNALDPGFSEVDPSSFATSPVKDRFLAVSRLAAHDWEKGIDHLIEAMARVEARCPAAHLHIVGEGVDKSRLQTIAQKLPSPEKVTFLGRVNDERLQTELRECQVFALPSRKEGFGLVYLEAMAFGKPCIVANAGGAPEVVDMHSGVVIPYGEVELLAETMVECLRTPWDTSKIRNRAKQFEFPAFVERWRSLSFTST